VLKIHRRVFVLGAAVAVAGSVFVLTTPAARRSDPNLAKAMAIVDQQCPKATRHISSSMWEAGWKFNVLYGNCHAGDGVDQHAWFFDRGRLVGVDVQTGSDSNPTWGSHGIIGLWRTDNTIALMYVLRRSSDPECCATGGGAIVRWRLSSGALHRLNKLPPLASAHQIGR
jgi:hypothetical protein